MLHRKRHLLVNSWAVLYIVVCKVMNCVSAHVYICMCVHILYCSLLLEFHEAQEQALRPPIGGA